MMPLLAWSAVRFGSPLADGYHFWVHAPFFSSALLAPPAGGGTEPNLIHYARALAGLGDLYPWPVAILLLVGAVEAARRPGPTRALLLLVLGFGVPLVVLQTLFFWQDTRFLLPLLPLAFALAGVPMARHEPIAVRVANLALGALAVSVLARTPGTYAPPKMFHEPATLSNIARRVEPNAALLVHTNGAFFDRLVRTPGTDRVWVPLGLDEHQLATRLLHLAPLGPAAGGAAWIDMALAGPFDPATAEATVRRLLRAGRPVYVSSLLAYQVPFLSRLFSTLEGRFLVEPVPVPGPWGLLSVRERAPR